MLSRTYFISEPTKRDGLGLYQFKIDDSNMTFYCDDYSANVRKIVNLILDKIGDTELIKLIYDYGEARMEEARESWYKNEG